MKKRIFKMLIGVIASVCTTQILATNLLDVYQQALQSDPTFKSAEASWQAARQNLPIARAAVLPNLSATGGWSREQVNTHVPGSEVNYYNNISKYSLNLTQSIFNLNSWMQIKSAQAAVKVAEATYSAAAQDLMMRVSTAYFSVLQAYDDLRTTQAEERSLARQLQQTEAQYKVGLIAVTGVNQIRATYDATVAQEIAAKNNLSDRLEELHAITGVYYTNLAGLGSQLPLVTPEPADINQWVNIAGQQNYTLQAANYTVQVALANMRASAANHLPTVSANGSYGYTGQTNASGPPTNPFNNSSVAAAGISVTLPIYSGGLVTAQTRQAGYNYAQASAEDEATYRNTVTQTRESYLGVISGISKIKADQQAIVSSESSLKATQAAYVVGTNTIVDVLQQQSALYTAQTNYAADQYAYLLNTLTLKQAAGTLSPEDLKTINSWLEKDINFTPADIDTNPSTVVKETLDDVGDTKHITATTKPAKKATRHHAH